MSIPIVEYTVHQKNNYYKRYSLEPNTVILGYDILEKLVADHKDFIDFIETPNKKMTFVGIDVSESPIEGEIKIGYTENININKGAIL